MGTVGHLDNEAKALATVDSAPTCSHGHSLFPRPLLFLSPLSLVSTTMYAHGSPD